MKFESILRKLTQYSEHHTYKMSCVIAKGNRVVSVGVNKIKTHSHSPHIYKQLHAEIDCVLGCHRKDLHGATAYVFRQHKDGSPALARPCVYCLSLLRECGIKEIVYSSEGSYKREALE